MPDDANEESATPESVDGANEPDEVPSEADEAETRERLPFLVAGIGGSAGGTEAYIHLIEHLPVDTGIAFALSPHLSADHVSQLSSILSRHTSMPVTDIESGVCPEPNHIYVLPSGSRVRMRDGAFELDRAGVGPRSRPIDFFFRSLAADQKNRAIGIVLSGMDSDGALGLKAIKAEGGITIVQSPESAKFPDMPRSSISAEHVDFVLSPAEIAAHLANIGRQFRSPKVRTLQDDDGFPHDRCFGRILALLRGVAGVDFRLYKPTTIRRRIARRMLLQRIESLPAYEAVLRSNNRELLDLHEDALISVTRFFRDPEVFEALKKSVLPQIFEGRAPDQQVRIWVAGCSSGEEVYSIAICLLEFAREAQSDPPIQIFGTDASERNIQKARAGMYPQSIVTEVSPERLRRYFVKTEKGYQVAKRVRDLCIFARQNVCHDPPFSWIDLISCRNVLIYFGTELQRQMIPTFHYALRHNGYLLLGSSETIREFTDLFTLVDRKNKIFTKVGGVSSRPFGDSAPFAYSPDLVRDDSERGAPQPWGEPELQRAADRIVLARFGPPGVIINDRMEILQSRGHTSPFLEMPQGTPALNLSSMARESIAPVLTDAVRRAIQQDIPVQVEAVAANGEQTMNVAIEVLPIDTIHAKPKCYLVLFVPSQPTAGAVEAGQAELTPVSSPDTERALAKMRHDLASTRLYLQSLLEERDAKNQELVSANEEIQSANEELQSSNEELETTKEELQSSNEELQTVNDELQNRNSVLTQASNDLSNLLTSVNVPVLMLSNELHIRHFTPPASRLLNVRASDIGRPFGELRLNLNIENLEPLLAEVLETLNAREVEVQDREGRWHLLRVRPYRTAENKIDGLVIVLIDIDQLRRSEQELREARDFGGLIIESIPLPVAVLDLDYRIRQANGAFAALTGKTRSEVERRPLPELAASLWGLDEPLRSRLAELRGGAAPDAGFQLDHQTEGDEPRVLSVRGSVLRPDSEMCLLVTIEDLTAFTAAERQLRAEAVRLAAEVDSAGRELSRNREDLRALTSSLFTSQEDERRRVARELHDDISQRLARLEMDADELTRAIGSNTAVAEDKIAQLREAIGRLAADVRQISHQLHPSIIDDLGLGPALRALADDFGRREHMIATYFEENMPETLPLHVATVLYRIAQEALRNVAKHAGRTHVKVTLRGSPQRLRLQVADAGIGFDSEDTTAGLGLISMRERARQLDAEFAVESALGEGTRITVDVPLAPEA